jgi:hypothetical protein
MKQPLKRLLLSSKYVELVLSHVVTCFAMPSRAPFAMPSRACLHQGLVETARRNQAQESGARRQTMTKQEVAAAEVREEEVKLEVEERRKVYIARRREQMREQIKQELVEQKRKEAMSVLLARKREMMEEHKAVSV